MNTVIGTDHLLLNAMTVFSDCGEHKIEEMDLVERLREISKRLVSAGFSVEASFLSRVTDEREYLVSSDVDEEIAAWEAVGAIGEEPGSRWLFYTDEGLSIFSDGSLDRWLNPTLAPEAVACIRTTAAELCPTK